MTSFTVGTIRNNRRSLLLAALLVLILATTAIGLARNHGLLAAPAAGSAPKMPQALWQAQALDSYRYTLQVSCFCLREMTRPVTIEVRDGEVAAIIYTDDGSAADPLLFERHDSIDDLFAIIAEAEAQNPAHLDVTYAEETGVPLSVDIDISEEMADEEIRFQVMAFEALQ